MTPEQLRLLRGHVVGAQAGPDAERGRRLTAISEAFDPGRLIQARRLAGLTKPGSTVQP